MFQDEESSGYDSWESGPGNVTHGVDTPGAAPLSILNPCYSGPDVDTHNSFASVLMNPTGKEKGDTKRFEGVEMRERGSGLARTQSRGCSQAEGWWSGIVQAVQARQCALASPNASSASG